MRASLAHYRLISPRTQLASLANREPLVGKLDVIAANGAPPTPSGLSKTALCVTPNRPYPLGSFLPPMFLSWTFLSFFSRFSLGAPLR